MADLAFSGLDEVYRDLMRLGDQAGPIAEKMLRAGAAEVVKGWQLAIDEAGDDGLVDSGDMRRSVAPSRNIKGSAGEKYIEIYPQGSDRRGRRNAEKAFIQHYGSSRVKATRFVDKAEEYGEENAVPVMQAVWDETK